MTFDSESQAARALEIDLCPFLVPAKLDKQHVVLDLNGRTIWSVDLVTPGFVTHDIPLPPHALAAHNTLTFRLPDAASPHSVEAQSADTRSLAIAVRAIREGGREAVASPDSSSVRRW